MTEAVRAPDKRWYVIHTYSGYENKVKSSLEHRDNGLHVGAGREFRHHSAVICVHHLRRHDAGEDGRPPANDACRCFVTRGLDAKAEGRAVVQWSSVQVVLWLESSSGYFTMTSKSWGSHFTM